MSAKKDFNAFYDEVNEAKDAAGAEAIDFIANNASTLRLLGRNY